MPKATDIRQLTPFSFPLRSRPLYAAAAVAGGAALLFAPPLWSSGYIVLMGGAALLVFHLLRERARRKVLVAELDRAWGCADELMRRNDLHERNLRLIREISEFLSRKTRTEEVVASVIALLEEKLDFKRGVVLLADEETRHLELRGVYGCGSEQAGTFEGTPFRLNNPKSRNPFVVAFRRKKPILVDDVGEILDELAPGTRSFFEALGVESFLACPIVLQDQVVGVLGVDNRRGGRPLDDDDLVLLLGVAPVIAISIHNAQLLEARQAQFDSTLHVLAESIDARDFLTAGHSRKVADYADAIAAGMRLPDDFRRMLRTAALLHDYGKIAIPDAILKKEGPLTDEERAIINTHPARTRQILEKIAFHGIHKEIPYIVLSHHERWDGGGYPNALQGEEIPLAARIIAVADYYEAITAKRHYRDPMPLEEALAILRGESGGHFDPRVLDAFLACLKTSNPGPQADDEEERLRQVRVPRSAYRTEVSAKLDRRIFAGVSVDISGGGLFFATSDVDGVSPDTEVSVTFELPQEKRLTQVRGKVAWVNAGLPRPAERLPEGLGVVFEELGDDVRALIEKYMEVHPEPASPSGPDLSHPSESQARRAR